MSEGRSAPGIDPRFDPRFQRGYVPSPESERAVVEPPPEVVLPLRPVRPAGAPAERLEHAHLGTPSTNHEIRSADAAEPVESTEIAAFADPVAGPESEPHAISRRWIVAAWVVAIGSIALGFWLFWNVAGDRGAFYGNSASIDPVLQQAAWTIAPPLMQAGGIGVVVLLAWQAIRRAQRNARDHETERP